LASAEELARVFVERDWVVFRAGSEATFRRSVMAIPYYIERQG
jgi:hypothetical protein